MSTSKATTSELAFRAKLSALWIFMLLNVVFRDIHEFMSPGFLEEVMSGTVNDTEITEDLLLFGGFLVEVPVAMVVLPWMLGHQANRWVTSLAAVFTILLVLSSPPTDADDVFFTIIEVGALLLIIGYVWKWSDTEEYAQ